MTGASRLRRTLGGTMDNFRRMVFGYPFIRNANNAQEFPSSKRALLVYLSEPFRLRKHDYRFKNHQNLKQSIDIAAMLGQAGYVVDVVDVHAQNRSGPTKYDLIVSHRSELDVEGLVKEDGRRVYLASGMNHVVNNKNVRARYVRLENRRHVRLAPSGLNEEAMPFVRTAHAVASFGNAFTAGSWSEVSSGPILPFNNYAEVWEESTPDRNWNHARVNFLFYASRNQVGKGLDLLLEIFPSYPSLHLYVCSAFKREAEFCKLYHKELFETPNIHPIGMVLSSDPRFIDIAHRCAYIILPSCSEGQPGSVIQAMHTGLLPIVTRECGIDVEDSGFMLPSDSVEDIEKIVLEAVERNVSWHRDASTRVQERARDQFSEKSFLDRWAHIASDLSFLTS